MPSLALPPLLSTRSVSEGLASSHGCPTNTVRPDANGWVPPGTCGYLSRPYYPSLVAALVFSVAAAAILVGHAFTIARAARRRCGRLPKRIASSWRNYLLLPWFGAAISTCLLAAYILRAFGTRYQQVPEFVVFSDTCVLVCPILVFTFDCIVLIRMLRAVSPDEKPVDVTNKALSCSVLVVMLLAVEQLIASVLIAPKHRPSLSRGVSDTAMLGLQLYLVGIGIQQVIVVYAYVLAVVLHRKLADREVETPQVMSTDTSGQASTRWRSISYALLLSLGAIFVRLAYRLVELSGFFTGYLLVLAHNEVFFYALECLPVLAALGVWAIVDTEGLLSQRSLGSTPADAYSYHEIRGELVDDTSIQLPSTNVKE